MVQEQLEKKGTLHIKNDKSAPVRLLRVGEKGLNFEKYKTWSTLYNEKIHLTYMGKYVCSSKNQAHEGGSRLSSHKQLASLKVWIHNPPCASERLETKWKLPFAYMQLSPPAREFRKAEWWSQNSSWPCLKHLTLTGLRCTTFCTMGSTCLCGFLLIHSGYHPSLFNYP